MRPVTPVGFQQLKDAWPEVVEHVQRSRRSAWSVVVTAQVTALREDVLTLTFPSQQDVASFKEMSDPSTSVSELLRSAIIEVLGLRVKFVARGPGSSRRADRRRHRSRRPRSRPRPGRRRRSSDRLPDRTRRRRPRTVRHRSRPRAAARQQRQQAATQQAATQQATQQQQPPQQQRPTPSEPQRTAPTTAPASTGPVTDWAVATIPATDPTAGAVPEHLEPGWSAPFGTTDTGEPVAPVTPVSDPAADAALAAQLRPASALGGAAARPRTGAPSEQPATGTTGAAAGTAPDTAEAAPATSAPVVSGPGAASSPAAGTSTEVPVDDYPLDDEPYDDGAPFPDPGAGSAAPSTPAPSTRAPGQGSPTHDRPQAATAPQRTAPAQQRTAPPQVRRAPVAGRYGEAVVREILGAQFIEETALHEEGA